MKKAILAMVVMMFSWQVSAGAYSSWAIPTQLEYVNGGILVSGAFGNPNNCAVSNKVFISSENVGSGEKFQSLLSILLTAFTAKKEVRFRSDYCFNVTFHGEQVSESRTAVYIR
ncbi:hypothetical protein [Aliikangiella coralliicola]|uniref:Uncharacterized protein n=1 Tax=Aliikangiella coralliicola TaxID=2592383 RepID=A0A545UEY8_9GAMM|nr:hypothetical protein [Aliikangiella coralliicola]TQV87953.1 hypothetical protein FLL46_11280 [Aliikangiella coralliicola]